MVAEEGQSDGTAHFGLSEGSVARFMPLDAFTAEVDRHLRDLRGSQLLPGFDAIRLPGDRRRQCREERSRDGVPLPVALIDQLDQLAMQLKIQPLPV